MDRPSRFVTHVTPLDLAALLRRSRRSLWLTLSLSGVLHITFVALDPFEEALQRAPRPLTTRFVKREPRLTKPLELRKVPRPKQRQLIRREIKPLPVARMDRVQATAAFNSSAIISRVANPNLRFVRGMGARVRDPGLPGGPVVGLDPEALLSGSRVPENRIDMALEMIDIEAMDTGRYRAMVVQDPADPQAVRGFVKLAQVHSARATELGVGRRDLRTLYFIEEALNESSGLRADVVGDLTYDDSRLLSVPVIVVMGNDVRTGSPSQSEMENLTRYLLAGGFILGPLTEDMQEGLVKYGGLVRGKDFWSERLPKGHPVFSAFYEFRSSRIPSGNRTLGQKWRGWLTTEGYFVRGRMVAIESEQGWGFNTWQHGMDDFTRQLQMAVNIVVFALTQEGSMTQRLMQMVN